MKKTVSIHAILTTLSPLHITSPESFRYIIDDKSNGTGYGRVSIGTKDGIACAGIQRRKFAQGSIDGIDFGIPFIAASNFAGRLRRQASQIVFDVLRSKKQQVTLSTYAALTCGAITGIPDSRDLTFAEYKESSAHPLIGLMGGGPRMLRRRMQVLDGFPVMNALRENGYSVAHPNGTGRASNGMGLTFGATFKRGDDISALLDVDRMTETVADFENAFFERQKLILDDKSKKDNDLQGSRYSTKAWSAFEFIAPGVDFDFTINLVDVTDAQIGLFLLSLNGLSKTQLGGQSRNGLGRFKLQDVVLVGANNGEKFVIEDIFNNNELATNNEGVAKYLEAWTTAATSITAAQLDKIMEPPVVDTAEEKEAKKAAKAEKLAAKKAAAAA